MSPTALSHGAPGVWTNIRRHRLARALTEMLGDTVAEASAAQPPPFLSDSSTMQNPEPLLRGPPQPSSL